MSDWLEKFAKAISVASEHWEQDSMGSIHGKDVPTIEIDEAKELILSHAPVIDAEKIADELWAGCFLDKSGILGVKGTEKLKRQVAQLITSSIDLNITWKDNKAEWGVFYLATFLYLDGKWHWQLELYGKVVKSEEGCDSQELAIEACEQALRSIVCGVEG